MDQLTKGRLTSEWLSFYADEPTTDKIDRLSDKGGADWESLCIGWCMAKGTTVEDAFSFYLEMVTLGAY